MKQKAQPSPASMAGLAGCAMLVFLLCRQLASFLAGWLGEHVFANAGSLWQAGGQTLFRILFSLVPSILLLVRRGCRVPTGKSRVPSALLLGLFLGAVVAVTLVNTLLVQGLDALFSSPAPAASSLPQGSAAVSFYFLAACVAGPVLEELFFRGLLQQALRGWGARTAVLVTVVLFTLAHSNPRDLLPVFTLGLLLGWAMEVADSVWPCILMHFANNTYSLGMGLARRALAPSSALMLEIVPDVIFLLLCFFILLFFHRHRLFPALRLPAGPKAPAAGQIGWRRLFLVPAFALAFAAAVVLWLFQIFQL